MFNFLFAALMISVAPAFGEYAPVYPFSCIYQNLDGGGWVHGGFWSVQNPITPAPYETYLSLAMGVGGEGHDVEVICSGFSENAGKVFLWIQTATGKNLDFAKPAPTCMLTGQDISAETQTQVLTGSDQYLFSRKTVVLDTGKSVETLVISGVIPYAGSPESHCGQIFESIVASAP